MADRISPEQRSRNMAQIKGRDTQPELRLRSALHRAGLRFRVCRTDLPGRPDIVLPRHKLAIQVRGCFWHQHKDCNGGRLPRSNTDYWKPKLQRNVQRDAEKDAELRNLGWQVLVIWDCEIREPTDVKNIVSGIVSKLGGRKLDEETS